MQTDAVCSMVIYTVATLAFYFLLFNAREPPPASSHVWSH